MGWAKAKSIGSKPKEATSTFIEDTGWVKSL